MIIMAFFSSSSAFKWPSESAQGLNPTGLHHVLVLGSGTNLVAATVNQSSARVSVHELDVLEGKPSPVLCAAVSPSGMHIAACTDSKRLAVWKLGGGAEWCQIGARELPKRAMVLYFTKEEQSLLVADKTGEVHSYLLSDLNNPGRHILGHFSMLLDMVLSPSNKHVITCDRDEKIRVSKYPNSYNIETFCLAHTEFVSSLCLCPKWPHFLLSGSGDGTVKLWEWMAGKLLDSLSVGIEQDGVKKAVTKVSCTCSLYPLIVAVIIENSAQLVTYSVSADGVLSPYIAGNILLPAVPWDLLFDWSDRLWVCLHQQPEPVLCYQWKDLRPVKVPQNGNVLLQSLSKWRYFEGVEAGAKDWNEMRKHLFDNMGPYMARKEERIKAKGANISPPSNTTPEPPVKKSKLTCELLNQKKS